MEKVLTHFNPLTPNGPYMVHGVESWNIKKYNTYSEDSDIFREFSESFFSIKKPKMFIFCHITSVIDLSASKVKKINKKKQLGNKGLNV